MFKTLRQKFASRASSEASGAAAGGARNPAVDEQAPSDLRPVAADAASGRHLPPPLPVDPSGPTPLEEAAGSNEAGAARFAPAPRAYLNAASEAAREMLLSARARALPRLADARADMREALFVQKLEMASVVGFCWEVPAADAAAKNAKREVLSELVEFLGPVAGQKVLTEATYKSAMDMVSANVFRSLPAPRESIAGEEAAGQSSSAGEGGDESENFLEPAWTHLQLVYEFFLRFILSNEVKTKSAKKFLDTNFCSKLIELFESEDPRERDYLKTILHRIYGKFMAHRSHIRKAISHVFFRFVYETERHSGTGELLEILGSIINGFALPLKPEHVTFLNKALMPLHKPRCVANYLQQLTYCITQYIQKDATTVTHIVEGFVRSWPTTSSSKQVLLLTELEEVLETAGPEATAPVLGPLLGLLARCVGSTHFQVAERALFLWHNETLGRGVLGRSYTQEALPALFEPLQRQASEQWNVTVESLANSVMKLYSEADPELYDKCAANYAAKQRGGDSAAEAARRAKWAALEAAAAELPPPG